VTTTHYDCVVTPAAEELWVDADCDGEMTTRDNQAVPRVVLSQAALSPSRARTCAAGWLFH
jgi:hypothetical protein